MDMQDRKARIGGIFALAHTLLLALEMPDSKDLQDRMANISATSHFLSQGTRSTTEIARISAKFATRKVFQVVY